jgi:hypothetical protein
LVMVMTMKQLLADHQIEAINITLSQISRSPLKMWPFAGTEHCYKALQTFKWVL